MKRRRHAYLLTFSFAALPPPRTYISSTARFLVPFPLVACSTTQLPFQTFRESTHQILTDSRPTRISPERTINSLVSTSKRRDSFVSRDNPPTALAQVYGERKCPRRVVTYRQYRGLFVQYRFLTRSLNDRSRVLIKCREAGQAGPHALHERATL